MWPFQFQGHSVVRRLGLAMINPHTKFQVSIFTHYEDMKVAVTVVCCRMCGRNGDEGITRRRCLSFRHSSSLRYKMDRPRGPFPSRQRCISCRQLMQLWRAIFCHRLYTTELLGVFSHCSGGWWRDWRTEQLRNPAVYLVALACPENSHPDGCWHQQSELCGVGEHHFVRNLATNDACRQKYSSHWTELMN